MSAAVVRLPTAAPNKVRNGRWAEQRRAARALREEQRVFAHPLHHDREAVIKAERLADFMEERTPMTAEMGVILGLVQLLDNDQLAALYQAALPSTDALTLITLARADARTKHLLWTVLQRRGLV